MSAAQAMIQGQGIRSFVAVPLPPEVQAQIFQATSRLASALPRVKWSRKVENLHVTLKFLGKVEEKPLARFGQALVDFMRTLREFRIGFRGFGAFPSARDARVVWAGVEDRSRGLAAVAAAVDEVALQLGFKPEERIFHGHVTVGRSRDGVDARSALDTVFGGVGAPAPTLSLRAPRDELGPAKPSLPHAIIREVHVYESQLGKAGEGSTYILRCRAPLGERRDHNEGDHHGDQREQERHQGN